MNSKSNIQTALGILAICIPLILGCFIWADIKKAFTSTSDEVFIFYMVEDNVLKIPINIQAEFESNVPTAKICVTVNGGDYAVPLDEMEEFMKRNPNARLSVLDENHDLIPELSIHRVPGY